MVANRAAAPEYRSCVEVLGGAEPLFALPPGECHRQLQGLFLGTDAIAARNPVKCKPRAVTVTSFGFRSPLSGTNSRRIQGARNALFTGMFVLKRFVLRYSGTRRLALSWPLP